MDLSSIQPNEPNRPQIGGPIPTDLAKQDKVLDLANHYPQALHDSLVQWIEDPRNKNATGEQLKDELLSLTDKYKGEMSSDLEQLKSQGYGPIIDKIQPQKILDIYADQVQNAINPEGSTPASAIPKPGSSIEHNHEVVQDIVNKIQNQVSTFNNDWDKATQFLSKQHQQLKQSIANLASEPDSPKKEEAMAVLNNALNKVSAARADVTAIQAQNKPYLDALKGQVSIAQHALQTFPTTDHEKAHAAVSEAKEAASHINEKELKHLHEALHKVKSNNDMIHEELERMPGLFRTEKMGATHHIKGADEKWSNIELKEKYRFPHNLPGSLSDLPFPGSDFPAHWYGNKTTSLAYQSAKIDNVQGFSVKMSVEPWDRKEHPGGSKNELAVFYNQTPGYHGGPEYGWVFRPDTKEVIFYTLTDANLPNQKWHQWSSLGKQFSPEFKNAMNSPDKDKTWSIKINKDGDFVLSITDGKSTVSTTVKRPGDFPNLSGNKDPGYITVGAQKFEDDHLKNDPHMKVDNVQVAT